MSDEGVNATEVSSVVGLPTATTTTTTTTTSTTSAMTTTLESRDEPETSPTTPPPPPPPPPPSNSHPHSHSHRTTMKISRKQRKYVHTSEGYFLCVDGKKIRSVLIHKKWPPRLRKVSFPSNDNDLVTGYLEPANPWEHAENMNIEDLISSYKTSCERHGTEPLQNVVAQLEKLDISDDERCPELCLKNETLDQHRCEPLEEILKRVQFEKLDLEASSLVDESAVILFDMLEYYQSAKHLDMSNNRNIGSRGWTACAQMIKKTTCLEVLEARDITLTQQHMNILKRSLQLVSHLHVLKLENCNLAGRAFVILISALKMNTGLKELYLADNGLEQEDAIQLGALLRVNNHLQLLDISNNHIKDEGARDILDGLITQSSDDGDGKGLSILVLWNNDLTKSSSSHFTQAIEQSITLETLNIGKNSVSNELLEMAHPALIRSRTLLQLGMQSTNITCNGALLLAEIIERNQTLQRIDLRDNNIQMTGLTALSFAMKKNTSITQLDLDDKPWSKTPATMHQYLDLVAEIRGHCARNDEPTSTDESTEESSSPQHRSRLSSVSSRKISLTCQTLPRSPPSMTPASNEIATRSMLEPKRTSGGRLRSPAPSPIPSPVASPIPSPSRSRFVVSRVSEASLSSTNSSASSSPVTPPSLSSSPTCFFPSTGRVSSRFRVVTVVEPASSVPPVKSVITSGNTNVTIGFNYRVHTPESVDSDDSDSVFRSDVDEDHRAAGNESSASIDIDVSFEDEIKTTTNDVTAEKEEDPKVEIEENPVIETNAIEITRPESLEHPKVEDNQTRSVEEAEAQRSENGAPTESTSNEVETTVEDGTKESEQPEAEESTQAIVNVDSELIETKANAETRTKESLRDEIIVNFQPEPKKPDPTQRQATSLERLLGLFQHPGSLFSGSSFAEKTDTKNHLQDGVNSMIALGDKFQQYLRDGRVSGKSGAEDSPSHAPLQRSVSDASRSTIKLDPVKSLSIPQLSSIQATCTRDFASYKAENTTGNGEQESKFDSASSTTRKIFVVDESPADNSTKSAENEIPIISDDLPLPETLQSSVNQQLEEIAASEIVAASTGAMSPERRGSSGEIVNSPSLNAPSESKTTICAPKLKDIPEYSVLEIRGSNEDIDSSVKVLSRDDRVDERAENNVETKCDSSTTDSINDPSYKNSSLCKVTCDISGVDNVHTLGSTDDVHNFLNEPLSPNGEKMLDAPHDKCPVISISTSETNDSSTATPTAEVEEMKNIRGETLEKFPPEHPRDSSETALLPDTTELEHAISNELKDESNSRIDSSEEELTIVANNVDLLLPVFSNLFITNNRIDAESRNAQNDGVSGKSFDVIAITDEDNELPDTVEEFLPIDAAASIVESSAVQQLVAAVSANDCINNNSHADDLVAVIKSKSDMILSEPIEDNISASLTDERTVVSVADDEFRAVNEIAAGEPIVTAEQYVLLSNTICAKMEDEITKIEIASAEDDDFIPAVAIEQVSTSLSEDSDYSSKLSVDDVRTGELSLSGSTANSPANDTVQQIVAETSITNNSLECINIHSDEASAKTTEHRSFVRVSLNSFAVLNVSNIATKVSTTSEVNSSESTEDLMFKITDINTDTSFNVNDVTSGIVTTVEECGDPANAAFFEPGQSSRSPTNLYIDKSRNVHRNSQDSGIEEATVSISDDNGLEGNNNQPRESFQESVDSGIDSECSSVCARVDVGADVQKERARDPGKSMIVDISVHDEIIDFSTSLVAKEAFLAGDTIAKIAKPTYTTEIQDKSSSTKLAEVISVGKSNEATTDRPNVSVRSTSPE